MRWVPITIGAALVLLVAGLSGRVGAGWGYALFLAAALLLASGLAFFALFALSKVGNTDSLRRAFRWLLCAGAAAYVLCVAALAGHYVHEAVAGRIEWHWIVFGPLALAALLILDVGLYRKLVGGNLPTWRRYHRYVSREATDAGALRRTFVDEVLLHRSLFRTSKIRWLRHTLIFWGFTAMFGVELVAVVVRDGFPAFGWPDVWREHGSAVRSAFDFAYDFTGCMIVAGCVLALGWRIAVNGSAERKYADTPTTLFLLFVVVSGFVVEALRFAASASDATEVYSFAGRAIAGWLPISPVTAAHWHQPLWLVHVIASCGFIAVVPLWRLVHSCATPLGRLMNSQQGMLAAKKRGVLSGLLSRRGIVTAEATTAEQRVG